MTYFSSCGENSGGKRSFLNSHLGNLGVGRARQAGSRCLYPGSFAISWARHRCWVFLSVCFQSTAAAVLPSGSGKTFVRVCGLLPNVFLIRCSLGRIQVRNCTPHIGEDRSKEPFENENH